MTKQREAEKFRDRLTKFFRTTPKAYWTHNEIVKKVERLWQVHEVEKKAEKAEGEKKEV